MVLDDDVLLHAVPNEAVARDRELVRPEVTRDRVAQKERSGEVVHLVGGEHERPGAVDREHPTGKEAGVVGEEAHHGLGDVAALVGDAERRALQNRQRHVYSCLTI